MLAPQPGLDCCAPGSSCTPASSHSTAVYTWSGSGLLPSPTIVLYAASAAAAPLLLTPLQRSQPLSLPASAQSVVVVISGGARHSWKIESGGDALISGTYHTCQPGGSASSDVPCSTHDAVAVLPLPVGFARSAPISMHVSVSVDYGDAAGLADFGVADDYDEDRGVDDATDGDSGHSAARRNAQLAHGAGLQFDRVGNGPASALQVRACRFFVLNDSLIKISFMCLLMHTVCIAAAHVFCGLAAAPSAFETHPPPLRPSQPLARRMAVTQFHFSASPILVPPCTC